MLSYLHRIVLWSLSQLDVRHQGIRWLQPRRTWLVNVEIYPRVLLTPKSVSALLGLWRVQAILQSSSFYGLLVKSLHCRPQYPCFRLIRHFFYLQSWTSLYSGHWTQCSPQDLGLSAPLLSSLLSFFLVDSQSEAFRCHGRRLGWMTRGAWVSHNSEPLHLP
jgi:hypothetical protein